MTPVKGERSIPVLQAGRGRFAGDNVTHPIMILPFSHSPSVNKPSQAMRTARHQNGGRLCSYEGGDAATRPKYLLAVIETEAYSRAGKAVFHKTTILKPARTVRSPIDALVD